MAEVTLKDNGPASYMAGGHRFLPGRTLEVEKSLALRLKELTDNDGKKIFKVENIRVEKESTNSGQSEDEASENKKEAENNEEDEPEDDDSDKKPLEETERFNEIDETHTVPELKAKCDKLGIEYKARTNKPELIKRIMKVEEAEESEGE